jgi:hypothetical protein
MRMQNTIVKGCVRDDDNKGTKVEFTVLLIWYGKLPGDSEKKKEEEDEEEKDNLIPVGLGGLW